jgi:hypothetical protein
VHALSWLVAHLRHRGDRVQIASWLAWNVSVAGYSLQGLKDLTDPTSKAARAKEAQERYVVQRK